MLPNTSARPVATTSTDRMMRAGVVLPSGDAAVAYRADVGLPTVDSRQVRIRLHYAALNRNDLGVIGERHTFSTPTVIGSDGAGIVDARGNDVDGPPVGAPVVILPSIAWGADDARPDGSFQILGHPTPGTHAEYVVLPAENVRPLPAGWSFADAAALPLAGLTAWRALTRVGQLEAGEKLLVTGASGGVATFLIDLARDLGARVYVTTSTDERLQAAMHAGAEGGVVYGSDDWPRRLRDVVGGGVDLAVDSAGDLQPVLETLAVAGRLVTLGRTARRRSTVDVGEVFLRHLRILGTTMGSPRDFDDLLRHVATVSWRPRIDSVWPLTGYAEAVERLAGNHVGKILLDVNGSDEG